MEGNQNESAAYIVPSIRTDGRVSELDHSMVGGWRQNYASVIPSRTMTSVTLPSAITFPVHEAVALRTLSSIHGSKQRYSPNQNAMRNALSDKARSPQANKRSNRYQLPMAENQEGSPE